MIPRRALLLTPLATPALAQSWPTRNITLVVPFAAGGNVDTVARLAAAELTRRLGHTVVVENAPGAGGTIGTERVARAAPMATPCWSAWRAPLPSRPSSRPMPCATTPCAISPPSACWPRCR